jgi:hypothetical protein
MYNTTAIYYIPFGTATASSVTGDATCQITTDVDFYSNIGNFAAIDNCVYNTGTQKQVCTNTDINANFAWIKTDGYSITVDTSVAGFALNYKYEVGYYFLIGSNYDHDIFYFKI